MSVNIDLGDPVQITCNVINDNLSKVPVETVSGAVRGGYKGTFPQVIPIEGEEGKKRAKEINVHTIPSRCIIYVYEASYNEVPDSLFGDFNEVTARVSIDIRMSISRSKLSQLDKEIRRIVMIYRKISPGENWSYIKHLQRVNLTNRKSGLFRIVRDIEFLKVSDYVGHQ